MYKRNFYNYVENVFLLIIGVFFIDMGLDVIVDLVIKNLFVFEFMVYELKF